MITLQYIIQQHDVPAVARHVCMQNREILYDAWQRRRRYWRCGRRIYYLQASLFFLVMMIALYGAYRAGDITASSPGVFVLTLIFFCLFVALPLLVPLLIAAVARLAAGRPGNEARFEAYVAKRERKIAAALTKTLPGHYTLYADGAALRWFIRGDVEKKEAGWRDCVNLSEDEQWLIFYFRTDRKMNFFAIPKSSPLLGKESYLDRLAQLRALRPTQ